MRFRRASHSFLSVLTLLACQACSRAPHDQSPDAAGAASGQALALLFADGGVSDAPSARSMAHELMRRADRAADGEAARRDRVLAGRLFEKVWRDSGDGEAAEAALRAFQSASASVQSEAGCDGALAYAMLVGERAKQVSVIYTELYRARTRAKIVHGAHSEAGAGDVPSCVRRLDDELLALSYAKPHDSVLGAIDEGEASLQGSVPVSDAGAQVAHGTAPVLTHIERWVGPEASRIVVHLSRPARHRVGDVPAPSGGRVRTFVEFDGVTLATDAKAPVVLGQGPVASVAAEASSTGSTVTLDVPSSAYRRVFALMEPFRLVIDVAAHPPGLASTRSVRRIAIDAGHGGYDPGAIGPSGVQEKEVTLRVAERLAKGLGKLGVTTMLTRDDDRFVSLEERTARANAFGADLFVSIHCNAAENRKKTGFESYVLDTSTSDTAGKVAARENGASQAAGSELGFLLASMRVADQSSRSVRFAELVQRAEKAALGRSFPGVVDGGVHRATFYVLVGARMPAVLFETSYLSNRVDEERLGTPDYQQRIADGIVNAVRAYQEGL